MPAILRGRLELILPPVQAQIASFTGFPADRILPVARDARDVPKLVGDQDILLRFRGFRTDGSPDNRGRHNRRCYHRLEVTIRTRFEMDSEEKDTRWLTEPGKGNLIAWEAVADALEEFQPADAAQNVLTDSGIYLSEGLPTQRDKKDAGWGETTLAYVVPVILSLTQLPPGKP